MIPTNHNRWVICDENERKFFKFGTSFVGTPLSSDKYTSKTEAEWAIKHTLNSWQKKVFTKSICISIHIEKIGE